MPVTNVAVVNRTFADSLFGGADPVGRKFRELRNPMARTPDEQRGPWVEIIGVVPDVPAVIDFERPRGGMVCASAQR